MPALGIEACLTTLVAWAGICRSSLPPLATPSSHPSPPKVEHYKNLYKAYGVKATAESPTEP